MSNVPTPAAERNGFRVLEPIEYPTAEGSLLVQAYVELHGKRYLGIFRPQRNGDGFKQPKEEDLITLEPAAVSLSEPQ